MSRLLERSSQPTSVIAANDVIAMGVLCKVNEVGLSVPDDIAIVGYDDIPAARLLSHR
jgi:LacI family transcriptional regulator